MSEYQYISYLNHCFKNNKLIRWPDNAMPLKIFVAPFRWYKAKDEEYEYYGMIEKAFQLWERASQGKVKFQPVAQLFQSQINIDWKRVERKSLGHCQFSLDQQGRLYSAEVHIGLSDGVLHQQYQNKTEVMHTIVHEIGHALGLQHSPFRDDIMYVPHQYGVTQVSVRDQLSLKWLYQFPYGATRSEIMSQYKAAGGSDIDKLIYRLETGKDAGNLQESLSSAENEIQLKEEQDTLAELNKFNISIQDVGLSGNTQEFFKKLRIKKDFGE